MSEAFQESPLAQFLSTGRVPRGVEGPGIEMRDRPFMGHLNLRGDSADHTFLAAVKSVLGFSLPVEPNTLDGHRDLVALWMGPDEWLVLTSPGQEASLAQALRNSVGDLFCSVADVTGGQTIINLRGLCVRDLLAKGCTLDLHPRAFGTGCCAQTLVAKANAIIRQIDDSPSFDIIVRRSFADYLALWIEDAAQEYGLAIISDTPI